MSHYYYPGGGWVGVEIIRIKAVLSSTGLELELSLAKIIFRSVYPTGWLAVRLARLKSEL